MRHTRSLLVITAVAAALAVPALAEAQARGRAVPRGSVRPPIARSRPPVTRVVPAPSYRYYRSYGPSLGFYYGYPYALGPTTWGPYGFGYGRFAYGAAPFGFGYGPLWYGGIGTYPYGGFGGYGYYGGYGYPYRTYGGVRIDVPQLDAEVYVDGYYAGIVDDFDGALQQVNLEPGPHRIEIRAAGFDPVTFEVNATPGRTITYRAALQPLGTTP
jgi:hypothetical protein